MQFRPLLVLLCVGLLTSWMSACDKDSKRNPSNPPAEDVVEDMGPDDPELPADPEDANNAPDIAPDLEDRPEPGTRVEVDLAPYLDDAPNAESAVRLWQSTTEEDLLKGPLAASRVGDYVFEGEHGRFIVEGDTRFIGPCPYGGSIIDLAPRMGEGFAEDVSGEVCLFLNASQTMKPDKFEILQDGSEGAAVLAVTGHLEVLDFINIRGIVASQLGGIRLNLPLLSDDLLPLTVTAYYIFRPGDRGVRVLTAIRNDGDEAEYILFSHLINSGADLEVFDPLSQSKGFGAGELDFGSLDLSQVSQPLPYLSFLSERSSYTFVPAPYEELEGDIPVGGSFLTIAGVSIAVAGVSDIFGTFLSDPTTYDSRQGLRRMEPGATAIEEHWMIVGEGDLSEMLDETYRLQDVKTGGISGRVLDADEGGAVGVRVSAVDAQGRTMNQALTGPDGTFSMQVPVGEYTLRGWREGELSSSDTVLAVEEGGEASGDLVLPKAGRLVVNVRRADGSPTPGQVMVFCEGPCVDSLTSLDLDDQGDGAGSGARLIGFAGVNGQWSVDLPAGSYRVVVNRGMEWSVWPPDAHTSKGTRVDLVAGEETAVQAEIAHVVDTTGALGGDFHVHSIQSPDSPVEHVDRVMSFAASGVDVLVSTDHDFVADLNPTIDMLGMQSEIVNLVGVELTTSSYGHYNVFPMPRDPESRNGGAFDWANGPDANLTPEEIFTALRALPGERVIQMNHPESVGMITSFKGDPLRGTTKADPTYFRIAPTEVDPETGDTGLWSDKFTAMELYNGFRQKTFWHIFRWWAQLLARGKRTTGTAVTDTHDLYKKNNGTPRTYVFVPEDKDGPETFDPEVFATSVNHQRALGTNGPFFRVEARNAGGSTAQIGDVLETQGESVNFSVQIQTPSWIRVSQVEVYTNLGEEILTEPGRSSESPVAPTAVYPIEWNEETDRTVVAMGELEHHRWSKNVEFTLDAPEDAYVIIMVRGVDVPAMTPMVFSGFGPFAFANPLFLDADGGGYNNPPMANMASEKPNLTPPPTAPKRDLTEEDVLKLLEEHMHH